MFLFRWLKRLVFFAILAGGLYVASGYVKIHGEPARAHADRFFKSELWKEGSKDLRTWLASVLKLAGEKVGEGITPEEQHKLNELIKSDLKSQIQGIKSEQGEE